MDAAVQDLGPGDYEAWPHNQGIAFETLLHSAIAEAIKKEMENDTYAHQCTSPVRPFAPHLSKHLCHKGVCPLDVESARSICCGVRNAFKAMSDLYKYFL